MALGAVAAMLLAFPVTAPARVTVDQTMHAAGAVRTSLTAISRSGHLTAGEQYSYRRSLRQAMRVLRTARRARQGASARRAWHPRS